MHARKCKVKDTYPKEEKMHIVMVPWLAMGHILPFHHLSVSLAQRGHSISFLSTQINLQRLPSTPQTLSHLITLVPIALLHRPPGLPPHANSTADISYSKHSLLKTALDSIEPAVASFIASSSPRPDWVIVDFTSHWLPAIARGLAIRSAFLGLCTALVFAFVGPPAALLDIEDAEAKLTMENFTVVPDWARDSNLAFRSYEIAKFIQRRQEYVEKIPDTVRLGIMLKDCDFMAIRTCPEFEPEWLELFGKMLNKPLIPIGFLPPVTSVEELEEPNNKSLREWLDKQEPSSVVYVALGSEVELTVDEVRPLALGLEKTGLPFLWVMKDPPESNRRAQHMLPEGFMERVEGQGMIWTEWAPQVWILGHGSVGGFVTHCGCNSFIEGLAFGRVLILLPMINDQGLNARLLVSKNLGVEVERDEEDGSYTPESVAKAVTLAMVAETGEPLRVSVREAEKGLFGNKEKNDHLVDEFVSYLEKHK